MKIKCSNCHKKYDPEISDFCPKCGTVNSYYVPSSTPEIHDETNDVAYSTMVHNHPCADSDGTKRSEFDKKTHTNDYSQQNFEPKVMSRPPMSQNNTIRTQRSTFTNPSTFSETEKRLYQATRTRGGTYDTGRTYTTSSTVVSTEGLKKVKKIITWVIILGFVLPILFEAIGVALTSIVARLNLEGIGSITSPAQEESFDMEFEDYDDPFGENFEFAQSSGASSLNGVFLENDDLRIDVLNVGFLPDDVSSKAFSNASGRKVVFADVLIKRKAGRSISSYDLRNSPKLAMTDASVRNREFAYSIRSADYNVLKNAGYNPCDPNFLAQHPEETEMRGVLFYSIYGSDYVFRLQISDFDKMVYTPWFDVRTGESYNMSTADMKKHIELRSDFNFHGFYNTGTLGGMMISNDDYSIRMYDMGFVPDNLVTDVINANEFSFSKSEMKERIKEGKTLFYINTKTNVFKNEFLGDNNVDLLLRGDDDRLIFSESINSSTGGNVLTDMGFMIANGGNLRSLAGEGALTPEDTLCGMQFFWVDKDIKSLTPVIHNSDETFTDGTRFSIDDYLSEASDEKFNETLLNIARDKMGLESGEGGTPVHIVGN